MSATITLCVLSSLCFCLCLRGMLVTARSVSGAVVDRRGYSVRAWRLARIYVTVAFACLALLSLAGAVSSYLELFS